MDREVGTTFTWSTAGFLFDIDERVDSDLFSLATEAWAFLEATLDGLKIDRKSSSFASRILTIYFATRIFGATVGGTMMLSHRLGREAIGLARAQYEYFIKLLYYDCFEEKAASVIRLLEAHDFKFARKVGMNVEAQYSPADVARLSLLSREAKDPNFTDEIVKELRESGAFLKSGEEGNPFAIWFAKNIDASFRTHWNYGSSVVHASPVDLAKVVVPRPDGHFHVNVDSRMKAPNKTIADLTQRCFSTMGILRERFGLGFDEAHIAWSVRFQKVADRHIDEPADTRSMHD